MTGNPLIYVTDISIKLWTEANVHVVECTAACLWSGNEGQKTKV